MEFGAHTCAVARASVRSGAVHVSAMEVLDPAAFPGSDDFSKGLRRARKALKLPRRVRAVVWGLPDGATRKDPAVAPILEPLVNAGFRIDRVVTPCNALAALARLRTPRFNAATCWLAINRDGVAVVAIRPGKLLYSNSFIWNSSMGATGSQARLLQRYSLVSVLAPEVKRAMVAAREAGTPVEGIVTCGNLPDLRSLTMPLIEELDVEVETLDSLEGLVVKPGVGGQIGDAAAAIRIACGAATARATRPWWSSRPSTMRRLAVPATVVVATLVIGWLAYARLFGPAASPSKHAAIAVVNRTVRPPTAHPTSNPQSAAPKAQPRTPTSQPAAPRSPQAAAPKSLAAVRTTQSVSGNQEPGTTNPKPATRKAEPPVPGPRSPISGPRSPVPPLRPVPPLPATPPAKPSGATASASGSAMPPAGFQPEVAPPAPLNASSAHADNPDAPLAARRKPLPPLLTDPLPRVTAILVADDRRFATIDEGHIITIGDVIGRRTVVAIDERSVVLREPSGVQIRVGLGGRLEGVVRRPY